MNSDESSISHKKKNSRFSNDPKQSSYFCNYRKSFSIEAGPSYLGTPIASATSINDNITGNDKSLSQISDYRQDLIKNPRKKMKLSSINKEKFFLSLNLFLYLMKFFFNLIGILVSIIDDYQYTLSFEDSGHVLPVIRFILAIAYSFEYLMELRTKFKERLFKKIFSWVSLIDAATIALLMFSSIFFLSGDTSSKIYKITCSLEDAVLCCRIIKLQGYVKFFFYYFKNEEHHSSRVVEINEMRLEFIDSVLFFISYLFISASIILSMDHIFDFRLFAPFNPDNRLSWHNALYYQLVTMTGIGYGDISPKTFQSRLVSALLIFYLTVQFTYFLTILISLLIRKKSVNKYLPLQRGWKNHIIVIGNLLSSESLTENFLRNHYSLLYKGYTKKFKSRMVFIYHKEPLQHLNNYLNYELVNEHYTLKKIRFIKNSLDDQSWMKDANLPTAKYLLCFFVINRKEITSNEIEMISKGILSSVSFAKSFYPKLQIFISLDSEPLLKEMKVYHGEHFHNSLSFYQLKTNLLALEIENEGAAAVISAIINGIHSIDREEILYLLNSKILNQKAKINLMNFIEGTFTRIVSLECPIALVGQKFSYLSLFLNFLEFSKLNNDEKENYSENFKYRACLIGVKPKGYHDILVNPVKYVIHPTDRLYLLANHSRIVNKINSVTKEDLNAFSNFKETFIEENILSDAIKLVLYNLSQGESDLRRKTENVLPKRFLEEKHCFNIQKDVSIDTKYLQGHIIIVGSDVEKVYGLIKKINSHSRRVLVILGSEKMRDHEFWEKVLKKRFSNVFYFYGNFLSVNCLEKIRVKDSFKVLILSERKSDFFLDFDAIQISRFFSESFPMANVFIEFVDEKSLSFLDKKPYQKGLPPHFYPLNIMGKVMFSQSVFCAFTASCFYKVGDIILKLLDPSNAFINSYYPCNPAISSLIVDSNIAFFLKNFGKLNFVLMQMNYPMIAIAIMKKGKKIDKSEEKIDIFSWEHDTFIVLPPLSLGIEEGDKIIMIGTVDGHNVNFNEKHMKMFKKMGMLSLLNEELEKKKWSMRIELKENVYKMLKDYLNLVRTIEKCVLK